MRPVRTAALAVLAVVLVTALAPAGASAARRSIDGIRDARYCEIIVLKGLPPTARATVYNTIGLNRCPAARWNAFQAGPLARELGATAVVLNGPRHFLMDAAAGNAGGIRSFHGLRLRNVASIPIRTAADVAQTPYTDRTIARTNTWSWHRGRTVYELVAPGGDTYVMQSYAQIKDPALRLSKLRGLGKQLQLPQGWRYRTRVLAKPLTLRARGRATILQDELQNTYQLATTTRRGPRGRHRVRLAGVTKSVPPATPAPPGAVEDRGTVTGGPFGPGRIVLTGTLGGGRLTARFRLTYARGSVVGETTLPYTITGTAIRFRGTARFTAGTGIYRGIRSGELAVADDNTLSGQSGRLSVTGTATY